MTATEDSGTYLDPELSVEERVADLLDRMSLEEKVGQLVGTYVGDLNGDPRDAEEVLEDLDEYQFGAVAPFGWGGALYPDAEEAVETANRLQRYAREETRLGIPLLFCCDAIHGHAYVKQGTVFPNNLGAAATWDPDLVERTAAVTADELAATGIRQNYGPTCDVGRDQRWGRTAETFGESPLLCAELSAGKVRGFQGGELDEESVAATAKHFPAYGEPLGGEDAAAVDVSDQTVRDVFLPPFERALDAGAASVMPCYNSIDGEPAHGSERYLTDLLRDEFGFDGHVVSDWQGIEMLHEDHYTADSHRESTYQTREAGLDVASVGGPEHFEDLLELVEEGELPEEAIDESVERVLEAKFRLGLFEAPLPDPEEAAEALGTEEHRDVARETVRKSLTLLQNDDDFLPLSDDVDEVFVGGPNSDDLVNQFGGWSYWEDVGQPGTTVLEGIREVAGEDTTVTHETGSDVSETLDVESAAERAADADVAVLALGEDWYLHEFGPSAMAGRETGEFPTRDQLSLPDAQRELVEAVTETGTPVVAVLITGRPLAVEWLAEQVPSLLLAYYPGTVGGEVVAQALFGEAEPGGRLPVTIPRSPEDLPSLHNYRPHPRPIGDDEHPPTYDPLFEFGHGLSYTTVEYRSVDVSDEAVAPGDPVEIEVTLENTGDRHGSEVVQLFARDEHAPRVTPVRELADFQRVELEPGEETTATLEFAPDGDRAGDDSVSRLDDGRYVLFVDEFTVELSPAADA